MTAAVVVAGGLLRLDCARTHQQKRPCQPHMTTTTMTITLHSPLQTLIKSYFPRLSQHVESLGAPVRAIFASWFRGA